GMAHRIIGPRIDVAQRAGLGVEARDQVAVGARINDRRVARVGGDPAAFAAADVVPVALGDAAASAGRGADRGIILLGAVGVIRKIVIERDAIELRGGV